MLSDYLLTLEMAVTWNAVRPSWRELRTIWILDTRKARTPTEVSTQLRNLESVFLPTVTKPLWRETLRARWLRSLHLVRTWGEVAQLLLDMEAQMEWDNVSSRFFRVQARRNVWIDGVRAWQQDVSEPIVRLADVLLKLERGVRQEVARVNWRGSDWESNRFDLAWMNVVNAAKTVGGLRSALIALEAIIAWADGVWTVDETWSVAHDSWVRDVETSGTVAALSAQVKILARALGKQPMAFTSLFVEELERWNEEVDSLTMIVQTVPSLELLCMRAVICTLSERLILRGIVKASPRLNSDEVKSAGHDLVSSMNSASLADSVPTVGPAPSTPRRGETLDSPRTGGAGAAGPTTPRQREVMLSPRGADATLVSPRDGGTTPRGTHARPGMDPTLSPRTINSISSTPTTPRRTEEVPRQQQQPPQPTAAASSPSGRSIATRAESLEQARTPVRLPSGRTASLPLSPAQRARRMSADAPGVSIVPSLPAVLEMARDHRSRRVVSLSDASRPMADAAAAAVAQHAFLEPPAPTTHHGEHHATTSTHSAAGHEATSTHARTVDVGDVSPRVSPREPMEGDEQPRSVSDFTNSARSSVTDASDLRQRDGLPINVMTRRRRRERQLPEGVGEEGPRPPVASEEVPRSIAALAGSLSARSNTNNSTGGGAGSAAGGLRRLSRDSLVYSAASSLDTTSTDGDMSDILERIKDRRHEPEMGEGLGLIPSDLLYKLLFLALQSSAQYTGGVNCTTVEVEPAALIRAICARGPSVTQLTLRGNWRVSDPVAAILLVLPLQQLDLSWCTQLRAPMLASLTLKRVDLSETNISDTTVSHLTSNCPVVNILLLRGCVMLQDPRIRSSSLHQLDCLGCLNLTDPVIQCPNLQRLDLRLTNVAARNALEAARDMCPHAEIEF